MWQRSVFAIDQFESGQTALRFTSEVAAGIGAQVRVIHIGELSKWASVLPSRLQRKRSHWFRSGVESAACRRESRWSRVFCARRPGRLEDLRGGPFSDVRCDRCGLPPTSRNPAPVWTSCPGSNSAADLAARGGGAHSSGQCDLQAAQVQDCFGLGREPRTRATADRRSTDWTPPGDGEPRIG